MCEQGSNKQALCACHTCDLSTLSCLSGCLSPISTRSVDNQSEEEEEEEEEEEGHNLVGPDGIRLRFRMASGRCGLRLNLQEFTAFSEDAQLHATSTSHDLQQDIARSQICIHARRKTGRQTGS
jgi:hypothetical protein